MNDVRVVEQSIHGGGGEGLWHDAVEVAGVEVAADREAAGLVGGLDDAEEPFGGVGAAGQQADVVDAREVGFADGFGRARAGVDERCWQKPWCL